MGGLDESIGKGRFEPLGEWLGGKIHQQGQRYSATELVQRITGRPLGHASLIAYLRGKLTPLYGLG